MTKINKKAIAGTISKQVYRKIERDNLLGFEEEEDLLATIMEKVIILGKASDEALEMINQQWWRFACENADDEWISLYLTIIKKA